MSWLFSRALVEAYSVGSCLGGEPSVPSKSTPTPQAYWSPGRTTDTCPRFRSGMMCEPLTAGRGADVLTSYLEAFPVRTSAKRGRGRGSKGKGRDCGRSSRGSFAMYVPASRSWRTHQGSLAGGYIEFSEIWPKWGMTRSGAAWRLKTPSGLMALRPLITNGNGSGSQLRMPTASASDGSRGGVITDNMTGVSLAQAVNSSVRVPTPCSMEPVKNAEHLAAVQSQPRSVRGGGKGPNLATYVAAAQTKRFPTPRAMDGSHGAVSATETTAARVETGQANLAEFVVESLRVPTPHGFSPDGKSNGPSGNELGRAVNRLGTPTASCKVRSRQFIEGRALSPQETFRIPTPTVQDSACNGSQSQSQRNYPPLNSVIGGSLNPEWVEWLQGWPIGWTDLRPLATDRFQEWQRLHGTFSALGSCAFMADK